MIKTLHFHIGGRIIKSSVSAAAAMLIADGLKLDFPSLAIVAAIIILQPTIYETLELAKRRMFGTLIGCALALFCVYYFKINVTVQVFLGTLIILAISSMFSFTDAGVLGIIAFITIITDPTATLMTAANRMINTAVGAITSIAINFIFPVPPIEKSLMEISHNVLLLDVTLLKENMKALLGLSTFSTSDFVEINNRIIQDFNKAYNIRTLMKREQRFASNNHEYALSNKRFNTLWDIHSSILQIHNNRESADVEISNCIITEMEPLVAILDDILTANLYIPRSASKKFALCVNRMEKAFKSDFEDVYYTDVYNEGSFLTVLMTNLKRISEGIKVFT